MIEDVDLGVAMLKSMGASEFGFAFIYVAILWVELYFNCGTGLGMPGRSCTFSMVRR